MELGDCGSSKQRLRVEARRVDEVFFGGGATVREIHVCTEIYI